MGLNVAQMLWETGLDERDGFVTVLTIVEQPL